MSFESLPTAFFPATPLAIVDGGTGADTASGARTALGLGSLATQASSAVTITGGSITGVSQVDVPQFAVPTEGSTVTATAGVNTLILIPAGDLTAVTVTLPTSPVNGQVFRVAGASHSIAGLTLDAGAGTVSGAITALAADEFASYIYRLSNTTWYRCG